MPRTKKDNRPLTDEEFAALKEVAANPMQHKISEEHRHRLIMGRYIRDVVRHSGSVYAHVPTEKGLKRLRSDADWSGANVSIPSFDDTSIKKRVGTKSNR